MSNHAAVKLSQRSGGIEPFLAMEIMERALEMERAGHAVAHLEIGEPDFDPPGLVMDACERALRDGATHYSDSRGIPELREAIARDTLKRFGVDVDPDRVLVTSGTSPAMLLVFSLLVDPGDEVVIADPYYPCYPNFIRFCGGHPVIVETRPEDHYQLVAEDVRQVMTERTRAIVVGSPANPTGAIQSRETLAALAELGLPLISDEIYDGLVYEDARVTSALEIDAEAFVLDGFSKRYAMTGFRLGYVIAPPWAMRRLQVSQQNLFISANAFVQHAGVAALEFGEPAVVQMREVYGRRREQLAAGLVELGFVIPRMPEGAFYLFVDARRFGSDSRRLAGEILEGAHVGVTPGVDFGPGGEGMLRFCYAVSEQTIDVALASMAEILPELQAREAGR